MNPSVQPYNPNNLPDYLDPRRSLGALLRLYINDKHLRHVTTVKSSVAIPSVAARWAASLSRGLHNTIPCSLKACKSRFCLLSLGIWAFKNWWTEKDISSNEPRAGFRFLVLILLLRHHRGQESDNWLRPDRQMHCCKVRLTFPDIIHQSVPQKEKCLVTYEFTRHLDNLLWCGAGSNRRHKDFQSFALPTELPHRLIKIQNFKFQSPNCYLVLLLLKFLIRGAKIGDSF